MSRKLYGKGIPPACAYCRKGKRAKDGGCILCYKKGIVPQDYHCRRFRYDPLKRVPKQAPALSTFTEADFKID